MLFKRRPVLLLSCSLAVLSACSSPPTSTPSGGVNPYAGGQSHPWSDPAAPNAADPYANGRSYPWASPRVNTSSSVVRAQQTTGSTDSFLSDLGWTAATNAWGPVEKDKSNGEWQESDGRVISIRGQTFAKGLGTHANSSVTYNVSGQCTAFTATLGVDDEVSGRGKVVYQVFGDGVKLYESAALTGTSAPLPITVNITGKNELKLVVTDGGDGIDYDHADWAAAKVTCTASAPTSDSFVSDLGWTAATNAWGPVEKDKSNGEQATGDGRAISIRGQTFTKGLGTHANSSVTYNLAGRCTTFTATLGLDDEVSGRGKVVYQVFGDGVKLYESAALTGASAPLPITVNVTGKNELKLVVTDGGDGIDYDHADWANAKVLCGSTTPPPPPPGTPALSIENPDVVPFNDRFVFSRIGSLTSPPSNRVHDRATVVLRNTGNASLNITDLTLTDTWAFDPRPTLPISLAPGATLNVPLRFTADFATNTYRHSGTLTITSNDAAAPTRTVQLEGVWQSQSENGVEPTAIQIMGAFGLNATIPGYTLNSPPSSFINANRGAVYAQGDEVISPYWQAADASQPVTVRQLAAFHTYLNTTAVSWYAKGSATTNSIFTSDGRDAQSLLPNLVNTSSSAAGTFAPGSGTFGFKVDDEWSDPTRNAQYADIANGCNNGATSGYPCGHHLRFWPARDRTGTAIPNTYLLLMDYNCGYASSPSGCNTYNVNYDYQDNIFLVSNVKPAPFLYNVGGPTFTDPSGNVWLADRYQDPKNTSFTYTYYSPSNLIDEGGPTQAIANTTNDVLYSSYRGNTGTAPRVVTFNFPLSNGTYNLKLHFADLAHTTAGNRVFDVAVNGTVVFPNLDIVAQAGGGKTALVKALNGVQVTNNLLTIRLSATVDYPSISGIEISR
ncbi:NPCBM/NEW2 domain-containing protein [Deinococcus yavapaiensis]|uniref:Malectin (Di-glucose binding ER protein) n=1 Tax=Deinococcus yavapaiensis KR-236 TaxID=694435 RepID=A0A318SET6_9DEIO|nr:NPCBM/NEW2 domain-containing protein [Deinococcus yavapaiensis]PYE55745.1 malectin (di-glucose binding ER protein) [Deinococcus yavapaiensis KR-236]